MAGADVTCAVNGEFLVTDIDLAFAGQLGPKAKRKDGDRPFFSYPYYISVKDLSGIELARETFAANAVYDSQTQKTRLIETVRQRLPLNNKKAPYKISVGFVLTDEQMAYNAGQNDNS